MLKHNQRSWNKTFYRHREILWHPHIMRAFGDQKSNNLFPVRGFSFHKQYVLDFNSKKQNQILALLHKACQNDHDHLLFFFGLNRLVIYYKESQIGTFLAALKSFCWRLLMKSFDKKKLQLKMSVRSSSSFLITFTKQVKE